MNFIRKRVFFVRPNHSEDKYNNKNKCKYEVTSCEHLLIRKVKITSAMYNFMCYCEKNKLYNFNFFLFVYLGE